MQVEALRMVYDELKKGENTDLYKQAAQKIECLIQVLNIFKYSVRMSMSCVPLAAQRMITTNVLPSCCSNIGQNRHQFVEKLLESLTAPCRNKKYGCEEMLKHYNKHEHEKTCPNSPCSCPVPSCNFKGYSLYAHFSRSHIFATPVFSYNRFNPITLERGQRCLIFCGEDNDIFVLSRFSEGKGSTINVVRIAPMHCDALAYAIEVKCDETSIVLQSSLKNIPEWENCLPERNFLLVPDYFATSEGKLRLQLCVWSGGVSAGIPNQLVVFQKDSSL